MEDQTKKWVSIAFAVVALVIAGVVISKTLFPSSSKGPDGNAEMYLLCKNCGEIEITREEFRKMLLEQTGGVIPPVAGGGPLILNCPKCGEKTCAVATKCPKCGKVFVPGVGDDPTYPDRCPECGYSALEELQKKRSK